MSNCAQSKLISAILILLLIGTCSCGKSREKDRLALKLRQAQEALRQVEEEIIKEYRGRTENGSESSSSNSEAEAEAEAEQSTVQATTEGEANVKIQHLVAGGNQQTLGEEQTRKTPKSQKRSSMDWWLSTME